MRSLHSTVVACLLAAGCDSNSEPAARSLEQDAGDTARAEHTTTRWRPLAPDEKFEVKSLTEWGIEWMRWSFSQTSCDNSNYDPDGALCRLYQEHEAPVFFMAYSPSDHPRTRCTIPHGRAVLVPLANVFWDNAGSSTPSSAMELERLTADAFESMRDLKLQVDGEPIDNVQAYAVPPTQYSYHVPAEPNWFSCNGTDGVANTEIEPAVFAGYFVLFPPPELGHHELSYGGVVTFEGEDYSLQMTSRFEVVAD